MENIIAEIKGQIEKTVCKAIDKMVGQGELPHPFE